MSNFIVNDDFFEVFPDANIGVIIINDFDNSGTGYQDLIDKAMRVAKDNLISDVFTDNDVVSKWRDAYSLFKKKKGARCSIEALLKRAKNETGLSSINPLVDLYNVTSLTFGLPCGGEDIDTFVGNVFLTKAQGNEPFEALGEDKVENPFFEEIVYKDDAGIICRCFNWREAKRTLLTENTTNAFIVMETVNSNEIDNLNQALSYMASLIKEHLSVSANIHILNQKNNCVKIK